MSSVTKKHSFCKAQGLVKSDLAKDISTHTSALKISFNHRTHLFYLAWNDFPTIAISETMTYPIEKVTFPAVTLCPQNSNPDGWGPAIKIFDYMKRSCFDTG